MVLVAEDGVPALVSVPVETVLLDVVVVVPLVVTAILATAVVVVDGRMLITPGAVALAARSILTRLFACIVARSRSSSSSRWIAKKECGLREEVVCR